MLKYINILCILGVFFLAVFLRFYQLGVIPSGLEQDETSIGYNSYSILKTGRDEYGKTFPLTFKAFGEYKLPGYIYATVPFINIFGLTEFGVRFVSALSGSLTVVVVYFLLCKLLTKDNLRIPIITAFFLAINPWSLQFSRGAFEVSLALLFTVTGLYVWIVGRQHENKLVLFLSLIFFAASVYTYNISKVLSPLLACFLIYRERKYFKKEMLLFISLVVFFIMLLFPFLKNIETPSGISSASGTLFYSSAAVQAPLFEFRSYITEFSPIFAKVLFNKILLNIWQYIVNIISYFDVSFFFVNGSSHGNHGIGNVGEFYIFEFPFFLIGIISLLKEKKQWVDIFLAWGVLTILIASLTRDIPQATRSFFLVVPIEFFSTWGMIESMKWIAQNKNILIRTISIGCISLFISFSIVFYFSSYYIRFPILYAKEWRLEDKDVSMYLKQHQQQYSRIIFDTSAGFMYTSLLFYTQYPPKEFQQTVKRAPDDSEGFSQVLSFGKYQFKDVDFTKDYQKGTLIITTQNKKPDNIPTLDTFLYPKRPVAIAIKQDIIAYPAQDIAYVLIAKQ